MKKIRMPQLSRTGRIVRNLLLCLPLLLLFWESYAYPLPSKEMNFWRMVRYYMLPEGELVFQSGDLFVTAADGQVISGDVRSLKRPYTMSSNSDIWICPLEEGVSPVPVGDADDRLPVLDRLLFLHIPKETFRAAVTLFTEENGKQVAATAEGKLVEDGTYLFEFQTGYQANCPEFSNHHGVEGWPYVLRLYDVQGTLLLEDDGVVPLAAHRTSLSFR